MRICILMYHSHESLALINQSSRRAVKHGYLLLFEERRVLLRKKSDDFFSACLLLQIQYLILPKQAGISLRTAVAAGE